MALQVFKADEATADYENGFFREFASNLVSMFNEEDLDGILIGHPKVPANDNLQPDCVLITANRLVLIDFKNHGGRLWLPSEDAFENSIWRHDNITIDGGASINPFGQLKKQRNWVEELIGFGQYGKYGIACVVCFQEDMKIMNNVPGKYQRWFSVTDKYQYLNRIRDVIGVKNNNNVDINHISSYFEAKPYHDYYAISLESIQAVNDANEKLAEAEAIKIEAENKVLELESKITEAESEKRSVEKLKTSLKDAKKKAESARKIAEQEKQAFDEKEYAFKLETQKAIRAKEEANKAKFTAKGRKYLMLFALILLVVVVIASGLSILNLIKNQNEKNRQEEERLSKLEEDYRNGRECIPIERVADFNGSENVCVDFYANYIGSSDYYIFIDNAKNGTFALMISKKIISESDAKSKYLNKHLEARGSIIQYENTYEIKITDLSQITIKQ